MAMKNFGTVPGENYIPLLDIRIDGVPAPSSSVASKPVTIFPSQTKYMRGCVGTKDFQTMVRGGVLQIDIKTSYSGPSHSYHSCTREQFNLGAHDFIDLEDKCGDPWTSGQPSKQ
jgi:hypothetical protein